MMTFKREIPRVDSALPLGLCRSKKRRTSPLRWAIGTLALMMFLFQPAFEAFGQAATGTMTGVVLDENGHPLTGATIQIEGTFRGVLTDVKGVYSIDKVPLGSKLIVSFLGMEDQTIEYKGQTDLTISMKTKADELEGVTVVAFAKQKKESMISSIATVNPAQLKVPSSNLTSSLGGRIAGIISYQTSGEPGRDNAEFFIRGVTSFNSYARGPLILIDNVELTTTDLARLQPDDIASFSVMKDATATSLYGARGANGVILVTTKEGREGPAKLNIRFEQSFSAPTDRVQLVDPVSYMRYHNEAVMTRDPSSPRPYTDQKIEATERGVNQYVYPANDWHKELFKDYASNRRLNLSLAGGGAVARYYVAGTLNTDNGILNVDERNNYNNNIKLNSIQVRSNTNIKVTKSTTLDVRMSGTFDDYKGPIDSGTGVYNMAMAANPVLFPMYFAPDEKNMYTQHILYGNAKEGQYLNPYAHMTKGYKTYSSSTIIAQVELKQNLDFITKGLNIRALGSTTRFSYFDLVRTTVPYYYRVQTYEPVQNTYTLYNINPKTGTEFLLYQPGYKDMNSSFYAEGAMDYNRTFNDKHAVSGLLVFTIRQATYANQLTLQESLPFRNLGFAGRFTYGYDNRYLVELNFGYNGSERFAEHNRFGFFPAAGVGWNLSNEKFMQNAKKVVTNLKLKATYGLVGNDAIGAAEDRFFYLSDMNLVAPSRYTYGTNFNYGVNQISVNRYANSNITWETGSKLNLGVELGLFNKLNLQADYFTEKRDNILMARSAIPSTAGIQSVKPLQSNVGAATSRGFEVAVDYNQSFNEHTWLSVRGNFTYAKSEYTKYDQLDYGLPWKDMIGKQIGQQFGLIAERLFIDEADIANSPRQDFGEVMPGDIKYTDLNNDGVINSLDFAPIGYTNVPNIVYGIGATFGWKGFDVNLFFQGAAQSSFFLHMDTNYDLNIISTAPFIKTNYNPGGVSRGEGTNAMLQAWADSHWSEDNRDSYALWPRLSDKLIENNKQASTWWQRDGTYLRLKTAELGYTLPSKLSRKIGMEKLRVYVSGTNLLTFSAFDMWDVEMAGNGLGYPIQRVINVGVNVNF